MLIFGQPIALDEAHEVLVMPWVFSAISFWSGAQSESVPLLCNMVTPVAITWSEREG